MCEEWCRARGNGVWIHDLYLFCPIAAAAECLHGALWWPSHALPPALFYKFLTQKSALTEPQLGLVTVGGWNIRR